MRTASPLRRAWTSIVQAEDYEAHMAANGQAQANAELVRELFHIAPPPPGGAIWFAGAGTGQMFDFLDAGILRPYRAVFTDINPAYLRRLKARLKDRAIDCRLATWIGNARSRISAAARPHACSW